MIKALIGRFVADHQNKQTYPAASKIKMRAVIVPQCNYYGVRKTATIEISSSRSHHGLSVHVLLSTFEFSTPQAITCRLSGGNTVNHRQVSVRGTPQQLISHF